MQEHPLVNFEFTLSQLSGNRELALKMLSHFKSEYTQGNEMIQSQLDVGNLTEAKTLVHTLKGVTGNIGITALHHKCKQLEFAIKENLDIDVIFTNFAEVLNKTLAEVDNLLGQRTGSASEQQATHSTQAYSSESAEQLKGMLQGHEFIPSEKLAQLLATCLLYTSDAADD